LSLKGSLKLVFLGVSLGFMSLYEPGKMCFRKILQLILTECQKQRKKSFYIVEEMERKSERKVTMFTVSG
jgi:hypothetical protein